MLVAKIRNACNQRLYCYWALLALHTYTGSRTQNFLKKIKNYFVTKKIVIHLPKQLNI
jgi:hypothetical protein